MYETTKKHDRKAKEPKTFADNGKAHGLRAIVPVHGCAVRRRDYHGFGGAGESADVFEVVTHHW